MSTACDKFERLTVQPGYDPGSWCVRWVLTDEDLLAGQAYVYRSVDGSSWGDPINAQAPVEGTNYYVDSPIGIRDNSDRLFYRVAIVFKGQVYDSPIGSQYGNTADTLDEREQSLVRGIFYQELRDLRDARNGYRAILYKPLLNGIRCPDCENVNTGLPRQSSNCPTCYGTRWVGGYANPVETWIKRLTDKRMLRADAAGGAGVDDQEGAKFRGLAFPLLRTNDVLIIPSTGERWTVGPVNWSQLRGIVPLVTMFDGVLMRRGDIRMKLPIP